LSLSFYLKDSGTGFLAKLWTADMKIGSVTETASNYT
jgi:hypothetical protein